MNCAGIFGEVLVAQFASLWYVSLISSRSASYLFASLFISLGFGLPLPWVPDAQLLLVSCFPCCVRSGMKTLSTLESIPQACYSVFSPLLIEKRFLIVITVCPLTKMSYLAMRLLISKHMAIFQLSFVIDFQI